MTDEIVDKFLTDMMKQDKNGFILIVMKEDGLRSMFTNLDQEDKIKMLKASLFIAKGEPRAKLS